MIHQHKFGDCFLLASILAILNQEGGADYIKSMMIQKEESTVVKLFDPNEETFVYYEISNSYHQKSGEKSVLHKAPWVHILEKAYVAHAYKKNTPTEHDERKFVPTFPAFAEAYGSGGHPDVALTILTGSPATEHMIKSAINIPWEPENLFFCLNLYNKLSPFINKFSKQEILKIDSLLSEISKDDNGVKLLLKYTRGNTDKAEYFTLEEKTESNLFVLYKIISEKMRSFKQEDCQEFMGSFGEYIAAHEDLKKTQDHSIVRALSNVWNMAQLGKYLAQDLMPNGNFDDFINSMSANASIRRDAKAPRHELRTRDAYARSTFHTFLRVTPKPPVEITKAFEKYLMAEGYAHRWDSELGTGIYSDESLAVYAEISNHLTSSSQQHAIVASAKFKASPDSLGLRSQHAYAVMGTTEKQIQGKALKFIIIRNPWGHTGRLYDWTRREDIATESSTENAATMDIELSDFMRYFYKYTVGHYQVIPVENIVTRNIGNISNLEVGVVGLIVMIAIGVVLALTAPVILLPIVVGMSLVFGTFFITEAIAAEKVKSEMKRGNYEASAANQKNSATLGKSSTAKLLQKFEAQEEVISRGGLTIAESQKPIADKENPQTSECKKVLPQSCAVEAKNSLNVSDMLFMMPSH